MFFKNFGHGKRKKYCTENMSYRNYHWLLVELSHPATERRGDVVTTSLCASQRRRRYVSNETPKSYAKVTQYAQENKSVFLWILCNFYDQLFFIEHLQWVPLPFSSAFWSYYWEDLLVILFTLTHPSKRFNTGLKLITEKIAQGVKSL